MAALNGVTLTESGRTRALVIADLLQRLPVRLTAESHDFVRHLAASWRDCTNEAVFEGYAAPRSHELPCVVVDGPATHAGGLAPAGDPICGQLYGPSVHFSQPGTTTPAAGDPTCAASGQDGSVTVAAEWAESGGRGMNGPEMMAGGRPIATGGVVEKSLVGRSGVGFRV